VLGALVTVGHEIVADDTEADIIIVNTCGFLESAKEEALQEIRRAVEMKDDGVCVGVIVTGCLPQRSPELFGKDSGIDAVLGIDPASSIVDTVNSVLENKTVSDVRAVSSTWTEQPARMLSTPEWMAYLKISDGCTNRCAYCTIPDIRGPFRSRPEEMVVEEAKRLAELGVRELILIGQDLTQYGEDLGQKNLLPSLLEKLNEVEGIHWIRLMYCYPSKVTDELISAIARLDKVAKYMDLPVQHGDDKVLRTMNRRGTAGDYLALIKKMRAQIPDIALRTTFIVGFPGETDQEFKNLLGFVKDAQFDRVGAFAYSREDGTPAGILPDQIPEDIKESRLDELMSLQQEISLRRNQNWIGRKIDVMIEGYTEDGVYGRSFRDAPDIDGLVYIRGRRVEPGEIIRVKIKQAEEYDLFA
jgi:ribosomal protein S12 methylthiotransferase